MAAHKFSIEQMKFLEDNITGTSYAEITIAFNLHFGLNLSLAQIKNVLARNKLTNGRNCCFHKNHTPFNKGAKGWSANGTEATRFKKGHIPKNHRSVGSERVNVDGYIEIKVAEPNKWRSKHIVVWETVNGRIPKGYAVIFADSNKLNMSIDNLLLVTRRQLLEINRKGLIFDNPEATKTWVLIADLNIKTYERQETYAKTKAVKP